MILDSIKSNKTKFMSVSKDISELQLVALCKTLVRIWQNVNDTLTKNSTTHKQVIIHPRFGISFNPAFLVLKNLKHFTLGINAQERYLNKKLKFVHDCDEIEYI